MPRIALLALIVLAAGLWAPAPAWAQAETWPDYLFETKNPADFPRGPGFYFSLLKIGLLLLPVWLWALVVDWINGDAHRLGLNYRLWNAVSVGPFLLLMLALWLVPLYWAVWPLLVLAAVVPLGIYARSRNRGLVEAEQVFTPAHLRWVLAQRLKPLGIKISAEPPKKKEAPVQLTARAGATERDRNVLLLTARQSPGFELAREVFAQAFAQRAESLLLDYTAESVAVRFLVDGVWLEGPPLDRQHGDPVLAALKSLCGLNPLERRARQQGEFGLEDEVRKAKCVGRLVSQGVATGERAVVQFDDGRVKRMRLPESGMRQKMQDELKALLQQPSGIFVVSAPPGHGLSSLLTATCYSFDRFMRSAAAVEEASRKELDVENIGVTLYDASKGDSPVATLTTVARQYPDVIVVPEVPDADTMSLLCDQVKQNRLIIVSVRAKEAAESLLRLMALYKTPHRPLVQGLVGAVNGRLVRKLCMTCREAYTPPPQALQQLGLPPDKVSVLYRPPTQPQEQPCPDCGGLGYLGRTAIFELLPVSDAIRGVLLKEPKLDKVREAARAAGMKTLQEEGIVLVAKGDTSIQELIRVLKESSPAPAKAS